MSKNMKVRRGCSDVISASEIGQYCYCSISWYLQKCGYKPESPQLAEGARMHSVLGDNIDLMQKNVKLSRCLAIFGFILLFIAFLFFLVGVVL